MISVRLNHRQLTNFKGMQNILGNFIAQWVHRIRQQKEDFQCKINHVYFW